jgi:hypothetical protein
MGSQAIINGPRNEAPCIAVGGGGLPRLSPLNNPMESNRRVGKKEIQTYAQHED